MPQRRTCKRTSQNWEELRSDGAVSFLLATSGWPWQLQLAHKKTHWEQEQEEEQRQLYTTTTTTTTTTATTTIRATTATTTTYFYLLGHFRGNLVCTSVLHRTCLALNFWITGCIYLTARSTITKTETHIVQWSFGNVMQCVISN